MHLLFWSPELQDLANPLRNMSLDIVLIYKACVGRILGRPSETTPLTNLNVPQAVHILNVLPMFWLFTLSFLKEKKNTYPSSQK